MAASIALESIVNFWDIINKRKENLNYLIAGCKDLNEYIFTNMEEEHEVIVDVNIKEGLKDIFESLKYWNIDSQKMKINLGKSGFNV